MVSAALGRVHMELEIMTGEKTRRWLTAKAEGTGLAPRVIGLRSRRKIGWRKLLVTAAMLGGALAHVAAEAAILTVGSGGACAFATVEAAIAASASGDTLRLAGEQFTAGTCTNFNITGKSLTLIGGYASTCNGALGGQRTVLMAAAGCQDSTLEIGGSSSSRTVQLIGIDLTGGTTDADHGGGLDIRDNSQVTLDGVRIYGNQSDFGGGLAIRGGFGASVTLRNDTRVHGNQATLEGGGIHCSQAATVTFTGQVRIADNESFDDGGGLFAEDCTVLTSSGSNLEIVGNSADGGGGMYLDGSLVDLDAGPAPAVVIIADNEASGHGGGFVAFGSLITVRSGSLRGNLAIAGGAGSLFSGTFKLERSPGGVRPEVGGNAGADGPAAFFVGNETAVLTLSGVLVDGHVDGVAPLIEVHGAGQLNATSTAFVGNVASWLHPLLLGTGSATLRLRNVTASGNGADVFMQAASSVAVEILASVFDETEPVLSVPYPSVRELECVAVPTGAPLPPGTTSPFFGNPMLAADRVHLLPTSQLVNLCPAALCAARDIDGEDRPQGAGCEPGADELAILFADGFESGDLVAW